MKYLLSILGILCTICAYSQTGNKLNALKLNLNESGSHYIQCTMLNQTWLRFNESNPGTLVEGVEKKSTLDIGLRRTRFQLIGQLSDRVLLYFQFGQNNFNAQYNATSNRKMATFFHDALCEYKISSQNQLKVGAGLTIANGLSRFSQPAISSIMTMDVPIFIQSTVDQTDQFSRKLSVYLRGQIGRFDYRMAMSDPFPITSNGNIPPSISTFATFSQLGHEKQWQAYFIYQFLDHEQHTTPYMTGTYLGKKRIFNIAAGTIYQPKAMWKLNDGLDTVYQPMKHMAVETFLDIPLNTRTNTALSAYAGFFFMNYGTNYLRYNGIMNPGNGMMLPSTSVISGQGPTYGNSFPMFGTGNTLYTQVGYLLPNNFAGLKTKWLPYVSFTHSNYDRLRGLSTDLFHAGINFMMDEHRSKFTLDWSNRPTYYLEKSVPHNGKRLNQVVAQYQIFM